MAIVVVTGSNEFARTRTVDKTYKDKYTRFVFIVRADCFTTLMFALGVVCKKKGSFKKTKQVKTWRKPRVRPLAIRQTVFLKLQLPHPSLRSDNGQLCSVQEHRVPWTNKTLGRVNALKKERKKTFAWFQNSVHEHTRPRGRLAQLKASQILYLAEKIARKTLCQIHLR